MLATGNLGFNMTQSKLTKITIVSLGTMIKNARLERGISQGDLASRLAVSRYTIMAIEKGDPKVAIGSVFEAAYIVGVPLLSDSTSEIKSLATKLADMKGILPKRASPIKLEDQDDDF